MMNFIRTLVFSGLFAFSLSGSASIIEGMEIKANTIDKNEFTNVLTLKGQASVVQAENKLTADEIVVMPQNHSILASGNCQYQTEKKNIKAAKMTFKIQNGEWIYMKETR